MRKQDHTVRPGRCYPPRSVAMMMMMMSAEAFSPGAIHSSSSTRSSSTRPSLLLAPTPNSIGTQPQASIFRPGGAAFDLMATRETDDVVPGAAEEDNASDPPHGATQKERRMLKRAMAKVLEIVPSKTTEKDSDVSAHELAEDLFDAFDKNQDGVLDEAELSDAGLQRAVVMNALDGDRSGTVDREEFVRATEIAMEDGLFDMDGPDSTMNEEVLADLKRTKMRLGGFEAYILVSVLTAQASFDAIQGIDLDWVKISSAQDLLQNIDWFTAGVLMSCSASAICGMYATVIFSLTILYGKTALGMSRDNEYNSFMDGTSMQRIRAFQAFSLGLFFFCVSILLFVCIHSPDPLRAPLVALSAGSLYWGYTEYDAIMSAAAPIFAPKETAKKE